jgi:hypothetical protein
VKILGKARVAEITAEFNSNVKAVWDIVTNNNDYSWRSDIERVEVYNNEKEFIEYTHNGIATKFIITKKDEYSEYAFKIENKMFNGFWSGSFSETENGGARILFKENIFIKNPIVRVISYLFIDLKKIQNTYILDLKKKLGE